MYFVLNAMTMVRLYRQNFYSVARRPRNLIKVMHLISPVYHGSVRGGGNRAARDIHSTFRCLTGAFGVSLSGFPRNIRYFLQINWVSVSCTKYLISPTACMCQRRKSTFLEYLKKLQRLTEKKMKSQQQVTLRI